MERQSVTMKQRPETERPYEKCLKAGAESLTDGEFTCRTYPLWNEELLGIRTCICTFGQTSCL